MTIADYYSEFMKQNFTDSVGVNYTPYIFMLFLKEKGYHVANEPLMSLCRYVYRFYVDNPVYAKQNSSILVSNLNHYFVVDLREYVMDQMQIWMKNGNSVFLCDGTTVFINPKMPTVKEQESKMLDKVIESLSMRNFKKIVNYSIEIEGLSEKIFYGNTDFDVYCDVINSTRFSKRAFEDLNYCPCCEETNLSKLQAIHLDFSREINNTTNSIVLCKDHAWLYYNNYFRFSKSGRVVIKREHPLLDARMHLNLTTSMVKREFL